MTEERSFVLIIPSVGKACLFVSQNHAFTRALEGVGVAGPGSPLGAEHSYSSIETRK